MGIFDYYNKWGKNGKKTTRTDFIDMVGLEGIQEIVKQVFLGGNVRDITEFITQRRLLNSYFAILDLFLKQQKEFMNTTNEYVEYVIMDLINAKGDAKLLDLWLLGLTKKGMDNIVRIEDKIVDYQSAFSHSLNHVVEELENIYGELDGRIEINGKRLELSWDLLARLFIAIGSQTLSIRGSSKSMNGKMFEKLVLGSLLTIMGFQFLPEPPEQVDITKKLFWLSNMDENERETDATVVYNGKAVSIDIGFIGKGNPEITLDKVTRFQAYKQIGGLPHDMTTIIIVDTVSENSDLFSKAERVNGHVLQMKNKDWTITFAKVLGGILKCTHELEYKQIFLLESYFEKELEKIDMQRFFI